MDGVGLSEGVPFTSPTWSIPPVELSRTIDWSFLKERFGAVYEDQPGTFFDSSAPPTPRHTPTLPTTRPFQTPPPIPPEIVLEPDAYL